LANATKLRLIERIALPNGKRDCGREHASIVIIGHYLASCRIYQMHPLASDAGDSLIGFIVPIAVARCKRLHVEAGPRAAKNEGGHLRLMHFLMTGALILNKFRPEEDNLKPLELGT
jgi:hypothetical protein